MLDLNEFKDAINLSESITVASDITTANFFGDGPYEDYWTYYYPDTLAAPSAPTACNKNTIGALNSQINNSSGSNKLYSIGGSISDINGEQAGYILIDRLSHQGGLLTNTSSAQTTNLPTAALTRYTDGVGVMMGLSIYVNFTINYITTVTVNYTNQAGTNNRVSPSRTFVTSNIDNKRGAFFLIPLQDGDYGVRSVQSVTLSTAGASATPNFGVVLFKPLAVLGRNNIRTIGQGNFIDGNFLGGIPEVLDDACLNVLGLVTKINSAYVAGSRCVFNFYETT